MNKLSVNPLLKVLSSLPEHEFAYYEKHLKDLNEKNLRYLCFLALKSVRKRIGELNE